MERLPATSGDIKWYDAVIIGGGLAGLICAIELSRVGHRVLVLEKKHYPFHKVCGEYVSNEVLGYLQSLGFDPFDYGAARIHKLRVSTPSGKNMYASLQLGGFGLSRFVMDDALRRLAEQCGAKVMAGVRVTEVDCKDGYCITRTANGEQYKALLNIGTWGKRDTLDKKLERDFINSHTGYMGVKYHIRTNYPADEIGLDNFPGGYCGITKIEGDLYNLCYLYQRSFGSHFKSVPELEEAMLFQNPVLKDLFQQSEFVTAQPEVINEICFAPKQQVTHHVLMCGDTAGLITPLCGNGMSMAIAAARFLATTIIQSGILRRRSIPGDAREKLEQDYAKTWQKQFGRRLYWGRTIQRFFGEPRLSEVVLRTIHAVPAAERWLIRQTHGTPL
jgi:flavin-dependent dehydrogenase